MPLTVRGRQLVVCAILGLLCAAPRLVAAQGITGDYTAADIAYGAQLYAAQCSTCHGPTGDMVAGVDLRSGKFRNASNDQELRGVIANGVTGTGMPPFRFDPPEFTGILAYLRNMNTFDAGAAKPGDAGRGKIAFEGKGDCLTCHRVNGKGSRVAPDLSDIGAVRSAGSLGRSLVDPDSQMMPINRPVRVVTRDGTVIKGRRLNEDTYTVQLIDDRERLHSLNKADLREFAISTTSLMPSYRDKLTADELADLLAYLLSLKGR